VTYGTERVVEEVSYVALHFHWPLAEILDLEHPDRRRFVMEIERLTDRSAAGR
jgi:hypothetical protein